MFFRRIVTKRNGKEYTYLKLIESYRENGKVKQRVIANLGNIDHIDPEKVNTLITSLNKLADPDMPELDLSRKTYPMQEQRHPRMQITNLDKLWQKLGMSDFLSRTLDEKKYGSMPRLIKTMVFQKLLFPQENRPIALSYKNISLPELHNCSLGENDFYQATICLAKYQEQLENHLFVTLHRQLNKSSFLYVTSLQGEYVGYKCDVNSTGTAYQVQPHHQPLQLLVTAVPPGIPINCSIKNSPFATEDISANQQNLAKRLGINLCMVSGDSNHLPLLPPNFPSIKSLPPEEFGIIPVSSADLWQDRDAFTVDNTLWVKDIAKSKKRYIICHDLRANTKSDQALEKTLTQAVRDLDKIRSSVRQQRLRREKTITNQIIKTLKKHECENYFNYRLNLKKQDIHINRNEEVIQKLKTLNRTTVLETNLKDLPALEIINAYKQWGTIKNYLQLITDSVKIPIVHPLIDTPQCKDYIIGQALINLISCTLEVLVGQKD